MIDPSLSDIELLNLLQAGNEEVFDEIYERHWEKLYITAYRKLGSEEDAQDIVQNIFIWLWEKRGTLLINESLAAYLQSAVRYKILNIIASRNQRQTNLSAFGMQSAKNQESPSQAIIEKEINKLLDKGIASMPNGMQRVFVLSRHHHLSSHEIADQLNISEQTVRNQISSGLKIVRIYLKDYLVSIVLLLSFDLLVLLS